MGEVYVFFRKTDDGEFFYPLELLSEDDAKDNAACNPGTVRVEDLAGKIIWALQ